MFRYLRVSGLLRFKITFMSDIKKIDDFLTNTKKYTVSPQTSTVKNFKKQMEFDDENKRSKKRKLKAVVESDKTVARKKCKTVIDYDDDDAEHEDYNASSDLENYSEEDENKKPVLKTSKTTKKSKILSVEDSDGITYSGTKIKDLQDTEGSDLVIRVLSENCSIGYREAQNIVEMFEDDCTVPFIVRYRGDRTGGMDADQIRQIKQYYTNLISLQKKKQLALSRLTKTQQVSADVRKSLLNMETVEELEHFCAAYKTTGRKTKAGKAKELGLETIAVDIMNGTVLDTNLVDYVNHKKDGLKTVKDVSEGVKNIMADIFSKDKDVLEYVQKLMTTAYITINSVKAVTNKEDKKTKDDRKTKRNNTKEDDEKYKHYYQFKSRVNDIKPHQMLALNRGEREHKLKVTFDVPKWLHDKLIEFCRQKWLYNGYRSQQRELLFTDGFEDSYNRLILPMILRKIRSRLNEQAQIAGIETFAINLKSLLLTNPIRGCPVLGIDPGFTHGNKMALVSASGNLLWTYVFPSIQKEEITEFHIVKQALIEHKCELIALGNGCGSRQMEDRLSKCIKSGFFKPELNVRYAIVNERGSSVYSCSSLAKEEFPDLLPNLISAVFIARSIQDPLNEYIKVEPESLGLGMYQRDMPVKMLKAALDEVVTECVSFVGVDVNVASFYLLKSVSGLNKNTANKIIEWRNKYGSFSNREQLKSVKGIGDKIFQQCSGFLRIIPETAENPGDENRRRSLLKKSKLNRDNDINLLDRTWIHPELYESAYKFLDICDVKITDFGNARFSNQINNTVTAKGLSVIAEELKLPMEHATLIRDALTKPMDYDYRSQFPEPLFRSGCITLADLSVGMNISGYVSNTTHFGAFIDVGVGTNGLIHVSKMKSTVLKVGERVNVEVLNVDISNKKIGLSLISVIKND